MESCAKDLLFLMAHPALMKVKQTCQEGFERGKADIGTPGSAAVTQRNLYAYGNDLKL